MNITKQLNELLLFTDGSVQPRSRIGYGAYLALTDLASASESLVQVKRFEDTSSSQLEIETLLWALQEMKPQSVTLYTDSQNIIGLPNRREKLERQNYCSKTGKPLKHAALYQQFFALTDAIEFTLVKVKGHQRAHEKGPIEKVFTLVDRGSRRALRTALGIL